MFALVQGALQQLVLRRCLSLVLLLDCAAQRPGVLNDSMPLLFRLDAKLKSSAEVQSYCDLRWKSCSCCHPLCCFCTPCLAHAHVSPFRNLCKVLTRPLNLQHGNA